LHLLLSHVIKENLNDRLNQAERGDSFDAQANGVRRLSIRQNDIYLAAPDEAARQLNVRLV